MELIADVEKSLVGNLIISEKKILDVLDIVKETDFITPQGRDSFSRIISLWKSKKSVDMVSLSSSLPGLSRYFAEAMSMAFPPASKDYARQIAREAKKRRVFSTVDIIAKTKKDPDAALSSMLSLYQQEMTTGKKKPEISEVMKRFDGYVKKNRKEGRMGFETGFGFLRDLHIQYVPGHIWTIGGWTSTGKTAVMTQKICNMISFKEKPAILVISTEMTEEQVVSRLLSNFTGIPSYRILMGTYHDEEEAERVEQFRVILGKSNLKIYDDLYTLSEIEVAFRKADLQGGINVGFIDYVQNCRHPEMKNQYQEQSEMAKRIQKLAKDVRATIICLSQVSNSVGRGETDNLELKGAGEWSAVSDVGVMLTRNKQDKWKLKYEVKKNRHGALGEKMLEYRNVYTSLREMI